MDKTLVDCWFHLNGLNGCEKKPSCDYRHSEDAKRNSVICADWPHKCKNKNCKFRHPSTAVTTCVFFREGKCTKGSACTFSHDVVAQTPGNQPNSATVDEFKRLQMLQEQVRKEQEKLQQLRMELPLEPEIETKQKPTVEKGAKINKGGAFAKSVEQLKKIEKIRWRRRTTQKNQSRSKVGCQKDWWRRKRANTKKSKRKEKRTEQ